MEAIFTCGIDWAGIQHGSRAAARLSVSVARLLTHALTVMPMFLLIFIVPQAGRDENTERMSLYAFKAN